MRRSAPTSSGSTRPTGCAPACGSLPRGASRTRRCRRTTADDEIKFYGIAAGAFFFWFYPEGRSAADVRHGDHAEDGRRIGNGRPPVDVGALRRLGEQAAAAAGLEVFGGDVIVGPSGELTLIDLNDWPSFAPCRDRASDAIAEYLMRRVDAAWNSGVVSSANESAV